METNETVEEVLKNPDNIIKADYNKEIHFAFGSNLHPELINILNGFYESLGMRFRQGVGGDVISPSAITTFMFENDDSKNMDGIVKLQDLQHDLLSMLSLNGYTEAERVFFDGILNEGIEAINNNTDFPEIKLPALIAEDRNKYVEQGKLDEIPIHYRDLHFIFPIEIDGVKVNSNFYENLKKIGFSLPHQISQKDGEKEIWTPGTVQMEGNKNQDVYKIIDCVFQAYAKAHMEGESFSGRLHFKSELLHRYNGKPMISIFKVDDLQTSYDKKMMEETLKGILYITRKEEANVNIEKATGYIKQFFNKREELGTMVGEDISPLIGDHIKLVPYARGLNDYNSIFYDED